jgi:hypothetical protein
MIVELKYGPQWRQERAQRWAERDRRRAAKLEIKAAKANDTADTEKQTTDASQS